MGLGGFFRGLAGKPPTIPDGAVAELESVPVPGIVVGTLEQRPYYDDDKGRHYLTRQSFSDLSYAEAYIAWVNARGALPQPPFPTGGV